MNGITLLPGIYSPTPGPRPKEVIVFFPPLSGLSMEVPIHKFKPSARLLKKKYPNLGKRFKVVTFKTSGSILVPALALYLMLENPRLIRSDPKLMELKEVETPSRVRPLFICASDAARAKKHNNVIKKVTFFIV